MFISSSSYELQMICKAVSWLFLFRILYLSPFYIIIALEKYRLLFTITDKVHFVATPRPPSFCALYASSWYAPSFVILQACVFMVWSYLYWCHHWWVIFTLSMNFFIFSLLSPLIISYRWGNLVSLLLLSRSRMFLASWEWNECSSPLSPPLVYYKMLISATLVIFHILSVCIHYIIMDSSKDGV